MSEASPETETDSAKREMPAAGETPANEKGNEKGNGSGVMAVVKLLIIVGILYVAANFGAPFMSQLGKNFNSPEEKAEGKTGEAGASNSQSAPQSDAAVGSSPHLLGTWVSSGYKDWLPEVEAQLQQWLHGNDRFIITHVTVHRSGERMEIRYQLLEGGKKVAQPPIMLGQDGFGGRFIYRENGKEFIVYPPQGK